MSGMDIATQAEIHTVTLSVHTEHSTIEAESVVAREGQAAEGRVTFDSATGTIGTAQIDVFDVVR